GARSFQPYRWDVTSDLKPGTNDLNIEVYASVAQARPAAATPDATAAAPVARVYGVVGGGGLNAPVTAATSGLLGSVKLVAY
ncbi:MAG TPA: hypothetical protein VMQ60_12595, partial [Acidobacteriaceae bacterium]|nr:hypothetical protein [Acidobacteriaceae bacterium]